MPARRMGLVLLPLLVIVLATFRDYGVTWDEPDHRDYGRSIVRYWSTGMREPPAIPYLSLYGGAFDGPATWIADASPLGVWPTRHLLNALVGLAGIAGAMAAGAALAGPLAGLAAGLLLALTPAWWGHMFNNPKDIPFAAAHIWAIALLLRWLKGWPEIRPGLVAMTGLAIGLALGCRVGGILLLGYLAVVVVWPARGLRDPGLAKVVPLGLAAAAIAWAVMMLNWPDAQRQPFGWPAHALREFVRFFPLKFSVLFRGQMYFADTLPWSYLPGYLSITLPELVLAGLAAAVVVLGVRLARREPMSRAGLGAWGLVAGAAVTPVLLIIAMHSVVFNGIRHVLFVVPPLCVIAGAMIARGVDRLHTQSLGWRIAAGVVTAGWVGWHLVTVARIHPQEYIWYNRLAGGLKGVFMKYELDYWGNSYPEAIAVLVRDTAGRRGPGGRKLRVAPCGAPRVVEAQLPEVFEFVENQADADFLVGLVGFGCGEMRQGTNLAFITRDGVPLSYVRALRPGF